MQVKDSHVGRISSSNEGVIKIVDNVTRWEELQESVSFHCKMASKCWIPTKFWLVNKDRAAGRGDASLKFSVCWGSPDDLPKELEQVEFVLKNASLDRSECPLAARIHGLVKGISKEKNQLVKKGRLVTLVICTQGLTSDSRGNTGSSIRRELQGELMALSKLPVNVIIRLWICLIRWMGSMTISTCWMVSCGSFVLCIFVHKIYAPFS